MSSEPVQAVPEAVRVLLVSPFEEDHLSLRTILRYSNCQPQSARSQAEALEYVRQNRIPVVICESELPDGSWKDLLAQFCRMDCPPMLVVISRFADEHLWSEVLNLGAYDVLAKPLSTKEVAHVVSHAARSWERLWIAPRCLARTA